MYLRILQTALVTTALASAGLPFGIARAQVQAEATLAASYRVVSFDIAPGKLGPALQTWAKSSGSKLLVSSQAVTNMTTPGLNGNFTAVEGLEELLRGTNLQYVLKGERSVTVFEPTGALEAHAQATALPQIEVQGANAEKGNGPVQGYTATQSLAGTKTNTSLLETPQAISVVGREQLVDQGSHTIVEALRYTAGVSTNINPNDNRFESIRIRGFEPVLYLDGMQLPYGTALFGRPKVDPFMLERVEVLKGPSSSLYGQVAPGGLVNMVSKMPTWDTFRTIELQVNNFGQFQTGFDVGGVAPKGNYGDLAYRLTGVMHTGGTQIDYVDDFRGAIAPTFTWRPNLDTTITFLSSYQRDDAGVSIQFLPASGTLLPNPNGTVPINKFVGEPGFNSFTRTQYWAGYQFEHRASDVWTLRQNLRYANLDTTVKAVIGTGLAADQQTLNRSAFIVPEKADAFTVDNQAEARFRTGPFSHIALFGLDFRRATSDFSQYFGAAPSINLFNTIYGAAITAPPLTSHTAQKQNQLGTYVQDQIAFDRWRLTLNGRHDWVSTDSLNYIAGTTTTQNDTAFSGRAGLNYMFDFGLSPYIAVSRSFQPALGTVTATGAPFKPTTGTQQEAGVKYQAPNANLVLTAAVYNVVQQNVTATVGLVSTQTGEVRSRGYELEANATLSNGLKFVASYTYTGTEVTQSVTASAIGKQFITVPKNQAAAWADYTIPSGSFAGLGFGAGIRYIGESYGDTSNTILIPSYNLVDAALHYDLSNLSPKLKGTRLALNVNNLFDKNYVSTCASLSQCYYGTGRTITGTLRYSW